MAAAWIQNVKLLAEGPGFVPGSLSVRGGIIERILHDDAPHADLPEDTEVFDGGGCYCFPGFVDIHFHGCMGADVCDGTMEAFETIAAYEASIGVTAICPATMTLPEEELCAVLGRLSDFHGQQRQNPQPGLADLVGINMEGPFISPKKCGAQDPKHIVPADAAMFDRFLEASGGLVSFIGLAPEECGKAAAAEFIRHVTAAGVKVSLCHTNADYEAARYAIENGAAHAVHLYNAMRGFSHREPGTVGAVLDSPSVDAELICDGIHIHPAAVRAAFAALGADRVVLISDTMRAAGLGDGGYTLGGLEVTVQGKRAVLSGDSASGGGALAGSVTPLPDIVRTAVTEMGIPLETAIRCATWNAAKSIGKEDEYGLLAEGRQADLVLWNEKLETVRVMHKGVFLP